MDLRLRTGDFGIELHAVGLDAHDGMNVCGEEEVGYLCQHRVGQVLDHEAHAVGPGPAGAEDRAGLSFAGFEGDSRPAQLATEPDLPPIMRAFIEEQRLARRNTMD